jgi:C-terminal processing protease CtpA/Prc
MQRRGRVIITSFLIVLLSLILTVLPGLADETEADVVPMAEIVNDEGGPVTITGEVNWTLGFFAQLYENPYIVFYDVTRFIVGDFDIIPEPASQVFGFLTSDYRQSPFTYQITLPVEPQGEFHAFGADDDLGVQVFMLGLVDNLWNDPFLDIRDDFYLSYYSAILSEEAATYGQITGGHIIVWAPEDNQHFPSGFGDDGELFTDDDPLVQLPAGYTIVDLSTDPFTFDRPRNPEIALIEPEGAEQDDFSDLSYAEAFEATVEKFRSEYAFTELKGVDWDALLEEFLPAFEQADANNDNAAYRRALLDFAWSIPDGHMFGPFLFEEFQRDAGGGVGIAIRDVDDGRVLVNFLLPGSPAAQAGMELRAEILEIDGMPIDEAIRAAVAWSAPFSTDHVEWLQKLRYAVRWPVGTEVEITFQNPGDDEPTTAEMTVIAESESFNFSSFNVGLTGTELPVEFEILDSGYGYIKIYSFFDNLPLTVSLWQRAMLTMNANNVPGIILDMRQNGGGFTSVGYQLMSSFFDDEYIIDYRSRYDESIDDFYVEERLPSRFRLPAPEYRYDGPLAVLIAPSCASACEFVTRSLTINDRAHVIGQYPTMGIAGGWQPFFLPDGEELPAIQSRGLDEDYEIIIEGTGIEPTFRVPVDEETLFTDGDPILENAIEYLDALTTVATVDAGVIALGEEVTGFIEEGTRVRYTLEVSAGDLISFYLGDDAGELDTFLRIYIAGQDQPALQNDDAPGTVNSALEEIEIPQDLTLIVEVGTFNDADSGEYFLRIVDELADDDADEEEDEEEHDEIELETELEGEDEE